MNDDREDEDFRPGMNEEEDANLLETGSGTELNIDIDIDNGNGNGNGNGNNFNDSNSREFSIDTNELKDDYFLDSENSMRMIRWSDLNNIYTIAGAHGGVSCAMFTKLFYVIGTVKGLILVFNSNQFLQTTLIPKIPYDTSPSHLKSPVKRLVTCMDGTHLCASYKTNDIFIWDLNSNVNKYDDPIKNKMEPVNATLHIDAHRSFEINGLGFVGERHTAIMVSDSSGILKYHSGYRNHLWNLTYSTKNVLVAEQGEKLLISKVLTYNLEFSPEFHRVAVLTTKKFQVLSTKPHLDILYTEKLTEAVASSSFMNNCISWNNNGTKLAFSIENKLVIYDLKKEEYLKRTHDDLSISCRTLHVIDEPILSLEWISECLLGLLTISHQFMLLRACNEKGVVLKLDLLTYNLQVPPDKHFGVINNHLYLLGKYTFKHGKFMTWSDIILNPVQRGDYITAFKFIEYFLKPNTCIAEMIQLHFNIEQRYKQIKLPFFNLSLAAMRFLLKQQILYYEKLYELMILVLRNLNKFPESKSKTEFTDLLLETSLESLKKTDADVFFEVMMNVISEGYIASLPATVFRAILSHYSNSGRPQLMRQLISSLDLRTLDVDLAVKLCKEYQLYDMMIYIWNNVFSDYVTPLISYLSQITGIDNEDNLFKGMDENKCSAVYEMLSDIYCESPKLNQVYLKNEEVKLKINYVIFNATLISWPYNTDKKLRTCQRTELEPVYPYFSTLLKFNFEKFFEMLDTIFEEDSMLNEDKLKENNKEHEMWINRQYIMDILVDLLNILVDQRQIEGLIIFLSKNITKYPQYIKFSNHVLGNILDKILNIKSNQNNPSLELALEYLLTVYEPIKLNSFIQELKVKKFDKVLFRLYLRYNRYSELLNLALSSNDLEKEFGLRIMDLLKTIFSNIGMDSIEKPIISNILKENFANLLLYVDISEYATLIETFDPTLHQEIVKVESEKMQQQYLEALFSHFGYKNVHNTILKKKYINLNCKYKKGENLNAWLKTIDISNTDVSSTIQSLKHDKEYESLAIIHMSLDDYLQATSDILVSINNLFSGEEVDSELLTSYMKAATEVASSSGKLKNDCWSTIITGLMSIYTRESITHEQRDQCSIILKELFIKLALNQYLNKKESFDDFCSILTASLENQDILMTKTHIMRNLLQNIFTAYDIEKHYSSLILKLIDTNSTGAILDYENQLREGWSCDISECEVCGKKIWGEGVNDLVFYVWEMKRRKIFSQLEGLNEDLSLVIFKCHHGFHLKCLKNLGQNTNEYHCLLCGHESNNKSMNGPNLLS